MHENSFPKFAYPLLLRIGYASGAGADILIAMTMLWALRTVAPFHGPTLSTTRDMLRSVSRKVIYSGSVTAVAAIVALVLLLKRPANGEYSSELQSDSFIDDIEQGWLSSSTPLDESTVSHFFGTCFSSREEVALIARTRRFRFRRSVVSAIKAVSLDL